MKSKILFIISIIFFSLCSNASNPVAQFTNTTVCPGVPMQFTDISTPIGSITDWKWDFNNDGIPDDSVQNPTHIFASAGIFPVKLVIAWGANHADTIINVTVIPIPIADAGINVNICSGVGANIGSASVSGYTYSWLPAIGLSSTSISNPNITTLNSGNSPIITTYTLTVYNGCTSTAQVLVSIKSQPTATFTAQNESSSLYCDGSIKAILTGGTGLIQDQWLNASQTVLSTTDSVGGLCPGTYTINLTDSNSCTNTYTETIQAGPLPPTPPICMVTVDNTNTHNLVIWEKSNLNMTAIDSIEIYREVGTNSYARIGAVSSDSLSVFDDHGANPASTGYRYKLKSKNYHSAVSSLSDYHNTIYLTNTGANFSWTQYQVENNTTPVFSYHIYRDDNSTGNFIDIGNTTGNQFGYTDVNFASFPNSSYYVEAVMTAGSCTPTRSSFGASRSNVKHIGPNSVQELNADAGFSISPNPFSTQTTITFNEEQKNTTIKIMDVLGKQIKSIDFKGRTLILEKEEMKPGIYFLQVSDEIKHVVNRKIVVQ